MAHGRIVADTARREEERFADTLALGLQKVEAMAAGLRKDGKDVIPGPEAFRLYDTFGVPPDLIRDVAQGSSMTVDDAGFEREMRSSAPARAAG